MMILSHKQVDYVQDAVLIVGACDEISGLFQNRLGILHCHSKAGILDHGQIIITVSAADHFICRKADAVQKLLERLGLVHVAGHDLEKKRFRQIDIQESVIGFP